MTDLAIPGFQSFSALPADGGVVAQGCAKVAGSLYFFRFEFARSDNGLRERVLSRKVETFCGKPIRGKINVRLEAMADAAAEAALTAIQP